MSSSVETYRKKYKILEGLWCTFEVTKLKDDPRPITYEVNLEYDEPDTEKSFVTPFSLARSDFWQAYCDKYETTIMLTGMKVVCLG